MDQPKLQNLDEAVVRDFGDEWAAFNQTQLEEREHQTLFENYFSIFPFDRLRKDARGFDAGCGSGRWAALMAPRVGRLHCVDPAQSALDVARERLKGFANVECHLASTDTLPFADGSQDFGYSLGVLHHIPDTEKAMQDCVAKLRSGAPFLVYLYYRFDNRPWWFRTIWRVSDVARQLVARLPFALKRMFTEAIALFVYWPLARLARVLEQLGLNVEHFPLAAYRRCSFYTMRTDALDRFGTKLEQRFTRKEIEAMMKRCGLSDIIFSQTSPYWVACGIKA